MAKITRLIILLMIMIITNRANAAIVIEQFSEDTLVKQQKISKPFDKTFKKPGFFKRMLFKGINYLTRKKAAPEKKYSWGIASAVASGIGIVFLLITLGTGGLVAVPLMMALLGIIFGVISKSNE